MNTPVVEQDVAIPSLHDERSQQLGSQMLSIAREMSACPEVATFQTTGWLPDAFFEALKRLYAVYDAFIEHNLGASELKIVCRFGCTRCCHQAVHGCYAFEIINLYRQLRPRADYAQIHDGFVRSADEFQSMLAAYSERSPDRSPDLALVNTLQHFSALAKPCPLLAGNNCAVYAHRPVSCRMYHSLTSPVYCTTVLGKTFHILPPADVGAELAALNDRLAFPYSEFLAQGIVRFAAARQFRPWGAPLPRV